MSLWKFQKLDHSKYKECYILFEPELCVDSDFAGFKSFMITQKKYKLQNIPAGCINVTSENQLEAVV